MDAKKFIKKIKSGSLDSRLEEIYLEKFAINSERERYIALTEKFISTFGNSEIEVYSAPGRSEICGNHTDHQRGEVIAAAINLDAISVASKTADSIVTVASDDYGTIAININSLNVDESQKGTTESLIKGVLQGFVNRGYKIGGFNAYVTSDVLIGAGLSSSAAYEVLIGTILSGLFNDMSVSPVEIAKIGQYAENVYFGKPCGLMDQMACSVGSLVHIDFRNPENPVIEKLELDLAKYGYSLCITDTKGSHVDLTPEYAAVPAEMKAVAAFFGKKYLSEVDPDSFVKAVPELRSQMSDRCVLRAVHYFSEIDRVKQMVLALKEADFDGFRAVIKASGDSSYKYLQNVYTNSDVTQQNVSVALALSDFVLGSNGVSRVHGGGFAGTIQAFVKDDFVSEYRRLMDDAFGAGSCKCLKIRKFGGIRL